MIKYYKFGFGRVSDYCNEEIRLGKMTRDEAIVLAEKYDDSCGEDYIKSFCEYIGISVKQFWIQVRSSVNKDLFKIEKSGKIVRKFQIGKGL